MRLPLVDQKAKAFQFVFIFFAAIVVIVYVHTHDAPQLEPGREHFLWPIYLIAVGAFCIVYMFLFRIEGKRQLYKFYVFGLSGLITVAIFHSFWYGGYLALAVMMAILLIIQLAPARPRNGGTVAGGQNEPPR